MMILGQIAEDGKALHKADVQTIVCGATVLISSAIPRNCQYIFDDCPDKKWKKDAKLNVRKNNGP